MSSSGTQGDIVNTAVAKLDNVLVGLQPELIAEIDEYRWDHRISSRNEAIRQLLQFAITEKRRISASGISTKASPMGPTDKTGHGG